ncbi:MAG: hypothetical protein V1806_04790 [Pseudomonadota bacterium]
MQGARVGLPPEIRRFSGLYRFISPERFEELGIDHEDVPLGTFPAEDHPPFLPDRFGGNAYGLGLFEQTVLPQEEAHLLEELDLDDPDQVAGHYRVLNDTFKRLGLLIRFSRLGQAFYLIPRQFVAHFLVEVRAKADIITDFLSDLLTRRLRETMRVGLAGGDHELLLPELQSRLPHMDFVLIDSLPALTSSLRPLQAMLMVGDPRAFALREARRGGGPPIKDRQLREAYGFFVASRLYDLLEEDGELLVLADRPLGSSRETLSVRFNGQEEFKRFLLFSHVYRTRRRYRSGEGLGLSVNRFDFHAFLTGLGVYHETVEGLLGGRGLARVDPKEIDALDYQDLPLPRGSAPRLLAAWRRWLGPFFVTKALHSSLPEAQRLHWSERYTISGEFPDTQVVFVGQRRRATVSLARLESLAGRRNLAGCDRGLLAGYKDSLSYALKVLGILERVRAGTFTALPGLELSRLRKPFEQSSRHPQTSEVLRLMELTPRLGRLEMRLNPQQIMGPSTPVMNNLEKLSLLGLDEGTLGQLYLIVLGHSTMARVTFGKLPETTLRPLTDLSRYQDLEEALSVIRLYRLLSVAEAAAAAEGQLRPEQVEELFNLYDNSIRVVTDPDLEWDDILAAQISRMGGVQAQAARKMLKLFDLFDFLELWRDLERAGPRQKEAMADFDPDKLARIQMVIDLLQQGRRFVGRFYAGDSSARPYFFRALLDSEMHGTGRLLSSLGTPAGFTLLWIGVHTSERRLINFNRLVEVERPEQLPQRLDKLRKALLGLTPDQLTPEWLAQLRETMTLRGEAYVHDSGIYLTVDDRTGALTPRFVDVLEELASLKRELNLTLGRPLHEIPDHRLGAMDRRAHAVTRFVHALAPEPRAPEADRRWRWDVQEEHRGLERQLEHYLLEQLFHLSVFAQNLRRLVENCPHMMDRVLPQPTASPQTAQRLDAAAKLSALISRRLDAFQDMTLSHELARAEFGATATGILGISPLQFQMLTASIGQLLENNPGLELLLMLALLLYDQEGPTGRGRPELASPLTHRLELARALHRDLSFLLEHHDSLRQVVTGEASLSSLEAILRLDDPPLVEALFILAVICTAAREEGFLSEDILERLFNLQDTVRRLSHQGVSAKAAHLEEIEGHARQHLAFQRYLEVQRQEAPVAGLRHLLETTQLPLEEPERQNLLEQGRRDAGLDRLLKLRGLYFIDALDLMMLRSGVPVPFIYRQKGLRSLGITHFERDLYEALRLYRGLLSLPEEYQGFVQNSLADPGRPVRLICFAEAADRLTYPNQIRLLLLGLTAAAKLDLGLGGALTVSFLPLAKVMATKFELVNEAFSQMNPAVILNRPRGVKGLVGARQGLTLQTDPLARLVSIDIADLARIDRRIEAVRRASQPAKLKRIYHQELKKLKLTTYQTLDYQQRLETAFNENLARLGEAMMERAGKRMEKENDLDRLEELFLAAWEEGQELPLSQDRQQSLRDLFEMHVERLRAQLLEETTGQLAQVRSFAQLDELWDHMRHRLASQRRHFGKDFDLLLAGRFDSRAQELRGGAAPQM